MEFRRQRQAPAVDTLERIALAGVVLCALVIGAWSCLGAEERLAFLIYDDAYYYLGVARSIANGAGSTFDGINQTNGYHPLWCWLLVPVFLLTDDAGVALRIAGLMWFSMAALACVSLWWALRPTAGPTGALIAAAMLLHPILLLSLNRPNGLETPLYAAAIAFFAGAWQRLLGGSSPPSRARGYVLLGLLLGLVILSRLDGGLLAVAAAILLGWHLLRQRGLPVAALGLGALCAGAILVAGPSLVWNASTFGSPVPVSGQIASLGAEREREAAGGAATGEFVIQRVRYAAVSIPVLLARSALKGVPGSSIALANRRVLAVGFLIVSIALVLLSLLRLRHGMPLAASAMGLLTLYGLLHYGTYAFWLWSSEEELFRLYYFLPQALILIAGLATITGSLRSPHASVAGAAGVVLLLLLLGVRLAGLFPSWPDQARKPESGPVSERYLYGWLRRTIPSGEVVAARDAGKIGYFSGHNVVNLDGLINDHRLVAAIRNDRLDAYVFTSPIRYLVTDRPWLYGYDVSRPEIPPRRHADAGGILYGLATRHGCTMRKLPGSPGSWVVIEITRPASRTLARNGHTRPRLGEQ